MKSIINYLDYRCYMRDFYEEQKTLSDFSWRKFAKLAGFVSPTYLKLVCDGKTNLSKPGVQKVANALGLEGFERTYFEYLVSFGHATDDGEKKSIFKQMQQEAKLNKMQVLNADGFRFCGSPIYPIVRGLAPLMPGAQPNEIAAKIEHDVSALVAGCGSDEVNAPNVESSSSSIDEILSSSAKELSSSSAFLESSSSNDAVISSSSAAVSESDLWYFDDTDGECEKCDSYTAQDPVLTDRGGEGSITTYGSITEKETSLGGACNYGQTNIQYYAAIHVNVSSGDDKGPWNGGLACGGCVRVKAKTPDGWKRVTVRITDRCPDESCGVDLGGAPASDVMGNTVGRYYGEWEFVSCEGVDGVWGDSTSIWVKDGANAYWSVIQVRNPKDAVKSISMNGQELKIFSGAENFWEVPQEILQSESVVKITATYRSGTPDVWTISGAALAKEMTNYYLYEYRE